MTNNKRFKLLYITSEGAVLSTVSNKFQTLTPKI